MEILRKLAFILLIAIAGNASAQSNAAVQKAFRDSYVDEYKKNYPAAIADMTPYNSESNYDINLRLGWLNFLNKNYMAAETFYAKAVALRPNALEAKFGYIKPLSLLANWNKVLDQYNAILKIDPQNTQANYWTGIIYYNRKQYDVAIKYFSKLTGLYPFDYDGNQMLGWSMLMAGKKTEALVYFEKALLIKPDDASCLDGISRCK